MGQEGYFQPESCELDKKYYIKTNANGIGEVYQQVRFLSYRPHPAEVLIQDGDKIRVIHRSILFVKESSNGERG